jgi:dTDP-D-glucose 4,6-dehydratase
MITRGYSENMAAAVLCAVDNPAISAGQIYNCGDVHQLTLAQWVEVIADAMGGSLRVHSVPGPLAYSARDLMISRRTSHHQLFDMHKIRAELGYEDKVPVLEALASTVRYYKSSPPEETDEMKANLAAHYATEDEMVKIVERLSTELEAVPHIDPDYRHPYAHPKKPGDKDHHGR